MTLCGSNQNLSLLINPLSPSTLLGVAVTKRHVDSRSETLLGRNFRTVSLNHITPLPSLLNSTAIKWKICGSPILFESSVDISQLPCMQMTFIIKISLEFSLWSTCRYLRKLLRKQFPTFPSCWWILPPAFFWYHDQQSTPSPFFNSTENDRPWAVCPRKYDPVASMMVSRLLNVVRDECYRLRAVSPKDDVLIHPLILSKPSKHDWSNPHDRSASLIYNVLQNFPFHMHQWILPARNGHITIYESLIGRMRCS